MLGSNRRFGRWSLRLFAFDGRMRRCFAFWRMKRAPVLNTLQSSIINRVFFSILLLRG